MNIDALSLDQMRAALLVAEVGSFSEAARRFNRAQSALSYAVTTLESQLGVALFERADGQKPTPTAAGRVLLREMDAVVRRADEIRAQAREIGKGLEHELSITLDSLFPIGAITGLLAAFYKMFPAVQLHIKVEAMGAVQDDVLKGRSVLGVIGSLTHLPAGLIGDALKPVVRIPVVAANHPLAKGDASNRIPRRLLLEHLQILQSDRSVLTSGRDFTVYTGRTWRVNELSVKRQLIIAGLGWGYMPIHDIADDMEAVVLKRVWVEDLRDENSVSMIVVRQRERMLGPAARWLLSQLVALRGDPAAVDPDLRINAPR